MDEELDAVVGKELSLLRPEVRSSPEAVLALLHDDFREFGASGRAWDRRQIVAELGTRPGPGAEPEDVSAVRVGDGAVLVTYLARRTDRTSLRSSLWVRTADGWRLFFHQGTQCPG